MFTVRNGSGWTEKWTSVSPCPWPASFPLACMNVNPMSPGILWLGKTGGEPTMNTLSRGRM